MDVAKVTQPIARLKYLCRMTATLWLESHPDDKEHPLSFLTETRFSPYSIQSEVAKFCRAQVDSNPKMPKLIRHPDKINEVQVGTTIVSLETLGRICAAGIAKLRTLLTSLTFGIQLSHLSIQKAALDDIQSLTVGYAFFDCSQNCSNVEKLLFQEVIKNTALRQRFTGQVNGNEITDSAARSYLDVCSSFLDYLFVVMHICYGLPARGTETLTIQIRNSKFNCRHLFRIGDQIGIVNRYHKARSITMADRCIARILPHSLSTLLYRYLCVVKPFET